MSTIFKLLFQHCPDSFIWRIGAQIKTFEIRTPQHRDVGYRIFQHIKLLFMFWEPQHTNTREEPLLFVRSDKNEAISEKFGINFEYNPIVSKKTPNLFFRIINRKIFYCLKFTLLGRDNAFFDYMFQKFNLIQTKSCTWKA